MKDNHTNLIGRRPVLKGTGVALAGLGGLTGAATASHGGPTRLTDNAADILVYWSEENDPDSPSDYGFPGPSTPAPPGGLTFAAHDPAGGGLFDFGNIVMNPDHSLTNTAWYILGGAVMATPPKEYNLIQFDPDNPGYYNSVGQDMVFQSRNASAIKRLLGVQVDLPVINRLSSNKWAVAGNEYARLALDADGHPDPANPIWGATRLDFYDKKNNSFELSLLYVISADDADGKLDDPNPEAVGFAAQLIMQGRLDNAFDGGNNGQSKGKN